MYLVVTAIQAVGRHKSNSALASFGAEDSAREGPGASSLSTTAPSPMLPNSVALSVDRETRCTCAAVRTVVPDDSKNAARRGPAGVWRRPGVLLAISAALLQRNRD